MIRLPGNGLRAVSYTHLDVYKRQVQVLVRDRQAYASFRTAILLLDTIREMYPEQIAWEDNSAGHDVLQPPSQPLFARYLDKLLADADYTSGVVDGEGLIAKHAAARENYTRRKARYHLYD